MNDFIPESQHDNLTNGDKRLIREFYLQEPEPAKRSCVYGIIDRKTGEVLYVGQTKALMRRISDHFRTRSGSNLLKLVEEDEDIDIQGGRDGNIWDRTAIKTVKVNGGKSRRRKIESVIEKILEPRYPSS